jgi:hypothetical protein
VNPAALAAARFWVRSNWQGLALALVALAFMLAASSRVVGLAWDDGVYVAAGQALAHGNGYVLANRAGPQGVPLFPPGYPLLVALVWLLCGAQSIALATLSVLSTLCVSASWYLWWRILRAEHGGRTAALLVAVPALSYAALATGETRMADAPYVLLVAVAAALWHGAGRSRWASAGLIAAAALAVPLRSAGAALTLAVMLLLLSRRRWVQALLVLVLAICSATLARALLGAPDLSYLDLLPAAWGDGGAGWSILVDNGLRGIWEAAASFVAPPLIYSGAVQRLAHGGAVPMTVYGLLIAAICAATVSGGWRRLAEGRWAVGDLALPLAVSLVFVVPLGMAPRLLVAFGPVLALWAWEGTAVARPRLAAGVRVALGAVLVGTLIEAARHAQTAAQVHRRQAAAYADAGAAARRWLGQGGLIAGEFPELLWFEQGTRSASSVTPLENVMALDAGVAAGRRRLDAIARGCLLDTSTFPASRALFEANAVRSNAVALRDLGGYVRVVCWPGAPAR